jgi:hypothetical protein
MRGRPRARRAPVTARRYRGRRDPLTRRRQGRPPLRRGRRRSSTHRWRGRPSLRPREGRVHQQPRCGPRLTRRCWRILVASLLIDRRGIRACCRLVLTREVDLGIRGVLLLIRGLRSSGPRLPLRTCDFARLVVLCFPLPLPFGSLLRCFFPLLYRLCVQAVDLTFLRDRGPRGVAPAAHPL